MRNTGNEILKKTLLHYINLEYYANSLDEEFQTLLEELQERCRKAIESQKTISTKASYTAIYRIIKEEVDKFQKELEERLEEQAELIMNQETDFLDNLYNEPTEKGKEGNDTSRTAALVFSGVSLAKVLFSPIDGRDTAKQFAERTGKNILRSYDTPLRAGYLFGQKSEEVTAQVSSQMKQVSRGIQSGIRTAIPSFAKTTDRIVFLNNDVEVVYCAVLDGRTCIVCGNNHGLHFKSISVAPSIPIHANCRCVYLKATNVTEPMPTYEEYIDSLSEDDQLHILGRNRYDLWKNYGLELKQFVNNGTKLRLDEIEISANIKQNIALKENMKKAKEMFPNETWEEKYKNVFVAEGRNPVNKHQQMVFEKEFTTAKIASDNGHIVYMLPEKSANKNPDTLMDGVLTDLKKVSGNIKTIGSRFVEGMKQGKNCYMQIESDYTIEQIRNKLKGEKDAHNFADGKVYIYLKGIEYSFAMNEL